MAPIGETLEEDWKASFEQGPLRSGPPFSMETIDLSVRGQPPPAEILPRQMISTLHPRQPATAPDQAMMNASCELFNTPPLSSTNADVSNISTGPQAEIEGRQTADSAKT